MQHNVRVKQVYFLLAIRSRSKKKSKFKNSPFSKSSSISCSLCLLKKVPKKTSSIFFLKTVLKKCLVRVASNTDKTEGFLQALKSTSFSFVNRNNYLNFAKLKLVSSNVTRHINCRIDLTE